MDCDENRAWFNHQQMSACLSRVLALHSAGRATERAVAVAWRQYLRRPLVGRQRPVIKDPWAPCPGWGFDRLLHTPNLLQ